MGTTELGGILYFSGPWFHQILGNSVLTWKCGNIEICILCYDEMSIKLSSKAQDTELTHKEYP